MVVQPRRSHRVSRWTHLLLVGLALLLPCAVARGADRERPDGEGRARAEGDRKEGDRKEGDRKEGDRKEGDRKEGDRKEGDRKEGDRKEGGEVEKPRMRVFGGEITKADGKSVTVLRRGDSGESSQTFAITKDTQILLQTDKLEVVGQGEGGEAKKRPVMEKGSPADLQPGKRVTVGTMADNTAVKIVVLPAPKPRKGGEGRG